MAQQLFKTRSSPREPKDRHLLSGLVFCGDCGSPMTFVKDGPRTYLVCSSSRRYPGSCKTHCVREDEGGADAAGQPKKAQRRHSSPKAYIRSFLENPGSWRQENCGAPRNSLNFIAGQAGIRKIFRIFSGSF